MHHAFRYLSLFLLLTVSALSVIAAAMDPEYQEGILVGRIAHTEGKLLRYIEQENDWVVTVRDAPFGLEDALYAGNEAKAEFIMPNRTWLRIGENTQIQLIDLNPDATTVDVAAGLARLYNKSRDAVMKVTTPFGYVVAPGGTIVDLYVGDDSVEVITIRGNVDFVHDGTGARFEMGEDFFSIIADRRSTFRSNRTVDSLWDDWNGRRDTIWAQRLQDTRDSARYLPEPIRDESYALAEYGRWERVYYEDAYHHMWRPTRVDPGWRPYTVGRWSEYYGDNCWIPDEPFGYVTHHYGSWVYVESFRSWYWSPPVARVSRISRNYGWHPGRVGWIHSGPSIGWVPLAPDEIYYGYRPWGHRTVIVREAQVGSINLIHYRYLDEAVIIHRDHLYTGKRYTPHVQRNVGRATLINNYRPTPVLNTVIDKYDTNKRRFAVSDAKISRKPHTTVVNRINTNQQISRNVGRISRERIERDLTRLNIAAQPPPAERGIRTPLLTPKLVDADKMAKPLDTISRPQKEIKPRDRERRLISDNDQRPGLRDQLQPRQIPPAQDEIQRMRSARDARNQVMEQSGFENQLQKIAPEQIETRRQRQLNQENQPVGSPEDARNQQAEQEAALQQKRVRRLEESQRRQVQELQQRQQEGLRPQEGVRRQQLEQRRQLEGRQRQEQEVQRQQEEGLQRQQQELQQRQQQEEGRRRPPQEVQRTQQEQQRQQQEGQRRQELDARQRQQEEGQRQQLEVQQRQQQEEGRRRQELEVQRQQQEEGQLRQQQELQQRQQQEEGRRRPPQELQRQQQEVQQRQQQEGRRRQEAETQRRQELEAQQRQQEGLLRQQQELQQEEGRRRPPQELQRQQQEAQRQQQEQQRQQQEGQRRQELEARQRQQEEGQRQQLEVQQRQLEGRQRQEQEVQRQQQEEGQLRQQQELQQRQQQEGQRRQEAEAQQRQHQEVQRQQQEVQQRHQQEQQRQQQEERKRQEAEAQQRQQQEGQRRQEAEAQQRQQQELRQQRQEEGQRRQPQEIRRKQQEEIQRQQQLLNQKKETQEEALLPGQPPPTR